jgi:hypothetical protein
VCMLVCGPEPWGCLFHRSPEGRDSTETIRLLGSLGELLRSSRVSNPGKARRQWDSRLEVAQASRIN